MEAYPSDTDILGPTAEVTTALARHTRSLDDRLTLLGTRMVYTALAFFFACFYFALTYLQIVNENNMWMPKGVHQPALWMGIVEVTTAIGGGLAYFWGQWWGLYKRDFGVLQLGLWLSVALTIVSIVVHIIELHNPGFGVYGGYPSVFIVAEGVFTAVLIITAIVMIGVANRARLGLFRESGIAIEAFGEYWGFITAIALLNFLGLYIQPFLHTT